MNKTDWQKFAEQLGADESRLATMEGVTKTAQDYYEWTDGLTPEKNDGKRFWRFWPRCHGELYDYKAPCSRAWRFFP